MGKLLRIAARVFGYLLLIGVTLEVCARVEDFVRYRAPLLGTYSMDSLYQNDAMGKYGRPGSSYLKWHLNAEGFRGPELRHGTYRIMCMGSSETFGLYESPGREWPRQLEDILNERAHTDRYEVVDVAYPGLSVGTSLRRLPGTLRTLAPRMAVIYPSYTPYVERGTAQPWPRTPEPTEQPFADRRQNTAQTRFELRLGTRVETFLKAALPERLQGAVRDWQAHHDAAAATAMSQLPEANIAAFEADLDHTTTDLLAHGVQVVLVTHADRFGPVGSAAVRPEDRPELVAWRKFFPTLQEGGLLDMERRMSDAVRRVGARHNVPVVDAATEIPGGGKNFEEFVHFTDTGAEALATLVANQIDQEAEAGTIAAPKPVAQGTPAR